MAKRIHRIVLKDLGSKTLHIGYVGENEHTQIIIDCSDLFDDYPNADVVLKARPPGGQIYEPTVTVTERNVIWSPVISELGTSGDGEYQLTFTSGTEIIKSAVGAYSIKSSLPHP